MSDLALWTNTISAEQRLLSILNQSLAPLQIGEYNDMLEEELQFKPEEVEEGKMQWKEFLDKLHYFSPDGPDREMPLTSEEEVIRMLAHEMSPEQREIVKRIEQGELDISSKEALDVLSEIVDKLGERLLKDMGRVFPPRLFVA
ncbi:TPA: hypothetical protein EYP66_20835 [Candidatus Poribacteria bacterium]|nr:hypothetical protein [Candidatus Poribacteria bacterium]